MTLEKPLRHIHTFTPQKTRFHNTYNITSLCRAWLAGPFRVCDGVATWFGWRGEAWASGVWCRCYLLTQKAAMLLSSFWDLAATATLLSIFWKLDIVTILQLSLFFYQRRSLQLRNHFQQEQHHLTKTFLIGHSLPRLVPLAPLLVHRFWCPPSA